MTQNPRSTALMVPYQILLWGTFGGSFPTTLFSLLCISDNPILASLYMMGRKILGYNTWFGKA